MWFSSPTFLAGRRQVRMSSPSGANLEIVLPFPFLGSVPEQPRVPCPQWRVWSSYCNPRRGAQTNEARRVRAVPVLISGTIRASATVA
jgi:hypothetical protein